MQEITFVLSRNMNKHSCYSSLKLAPAHDTAALIWYLVNHKDNNRDGIWTITYLESMADCWNVETYCASWRQAMADGEMRSAKSEDFRHRRFLPAWVRGFQQYVSLSLHIFLWSPSEETSTEVMEIKHFCIKTWSCLDK